ncbi:VWA domain-containing protein [Achromobacter seleniivolatilans]|uniref:VWA domain-containing protein n=1 Tax=Achromobacter seleniivolatilans TaxID=3047478 RepID=A0ABY9M5R4_9BURK|nr:VWA domain-containing protein [Achromobacter sp. R39]WMD22047.1 VWA domain-containing protein [Achromobacter sp. R39]
MEIDLSAFHFLRPWWLLAVPAALALLWLRRSEGSRLGWRSSISPALLPYLTVDAAGSAGPRPIHAVAALLILGGIAAAGPTWEQDRPPFLDNQAPLIVAVDLSPSMDANDVPPSRLEAVKHKLHDLLARRTGAKTGLIAYAGSAHLVLPPTDDPNLVDLFVQSLSTSLIAAPGRDVAGVITLAESVLQATQAGGTLLLATDGADTDQLAQVQQLAKGSDFQILILATGTAHGGVLHDARGQPRMDAQGKPLLGTFNTDAIKQLAQAARAPLGSLTVNEDDLDWVQLHAQRHFQEVQDAGQPMHWKDAGYWLCWPLGLLALLGLRRGWNVNWTAGLLLAWMTGVYPSTANAGPVADAFFTPDQQGRWAYEHHDFAGAAAAFQDPYWKGRAAYDAGDYRAALAAFARLDTPEAYFYLGNTQARLRNYDAALASYDHALRMRSPFPEAVQNRALVAKLQAAIESEQTGQNSDKPDEVAYDNKKGAGKMGDVAVAKASSADVWLRNLSLSPAGFLKQKFAIEDAKKAAAPAGGPRP